MNENDVHTKNVLCQHTIAPPQVPGGGDSLQLYRVAEYVNRQGVVLT